VSQRPKTPREEAALAIARARLRSADATLIAWRAGVQYEPHADSDGVVRVPFLGRRYAVSYPEGEVREEGSDRAPGHATTLLLLHYLGHADGYPMADRWVAFRELPDGLVYDRAFAGRVEPPLLRAYANDLERFRTAACALGGSPLAYGDVGFMFAVLPRVRAAVIFYLGDDELPPAVRVLYDASAGHYLPAEDLAILGGVLVGALLRAVPR